MKKVLLAKAISLALMLTMAVTANAVPARPGLWRLITLSDGTKVHAFLKGDEHLHYYADRENNVYTEREDGLFEKRDFKALVAEVKKHQAEEEAELLKKSPSKAPRKAQGIPTNKSIFTGKKKGIVILVEFPQAVDSRTGKVTAEAVKFNTENPGKFGCSSVNELYTKIINERGLNMDPFYGSVKDYFLAQSDGVFELDFDVAGPYTLANEYSYYGKNGTYSTDTNVRTMISEAVSKANANFDFSNYDWDGDGTVEVVYVLYAGQGEADGGAANTVWPHKSTVSGVSADGKAISTYACSNELATNQTYNSSSRTYTTNGTQINGIGTICHEFSHTIGFPDMYDTNDDGTNWPSDCLPGAFDLMCSGSYNGSWNGGNDDWATIDAGYRPCGYSAFERWCAGWIEPKELSDPQRVTNMKPLGGTYDGGPSDHGDAYVVYMPNSTKSIKGEYYLLENRGWGNWDGAIPWPGLLINYVHYNESSWQNNTLNNVSSSSITHARMTHFQASGVDVANVMGFDPYPYQVELFPHLYDSSSSIYDEDGGKIAENINNANSQYSKYFKLNTTSNNSLDNTTNPKAYYWSTKSSAQTLSNQEIWNIEANYCDPATWGFNFSAADQSVNFNYRKPSTKTLTINQDATTAENIGTGFYTKFTVNKPIKAGILTTMWLPFDMNTSDLIKRFGTKFGVYRFTGTTEDEEGNVSLNLESCIYDGVKAYEPFFLLIDKDEADIDNLGDFENIQVNTASADIEPVVTTSDGWKLVGTKTYDVVPKGAYFMSNNMYYKSTGTTKLRAYRAYLVAPDEQAASKKNIVTHFDDSKKTNETAEEVREQGFARLRAKLDMNNIASPFFNPNATTGIDRNVVEMSSEKCSDNGVYNLAGQRVGTVGKSSLPKGVYIANGKKFTVTK